jgi:hypothetical protein
MRESEIESAWRKHYKAKGWLMLKWVSPGFVGVPDRIVLGPGPTFFFVEFKAKGEKPTPKQEKVHNLLRSFGFTVEVIDALPE